MTTPLQYYLHGVLIPDGSLRANLAELLRDELAIRTEDGQVTSFEQQIDAAARRYQRRYGGRRRRGWAHMICEAEPEGDVQ